jgi:tripartite-type tricarboxylate transporter receptor subunit TctC
MRLWAIACAWTICAGGAWGQTRDDYPKRPVRFIVAQTPGGSADFVGRIIADALGKRFSQQLVVDNRPGASGIIACEITVMAPPDGHTLLLVTTSFGVNPALYRKLPYDPINDLAPITHIAHAPMVLVVSPSLRVQTVADLITLARAKPASLNYGASSIGGATQLAAELFNLMAKVKMTLIPYKGAPAMLLDLMGGRIDLSFASMPSAMVHLRSGKLRGVAVTSLKRSTQMPELPTVAETGVPGYEMVAWQGLLAPKATPRPILQLLNREVAAIVQQPEVRKQLSAEGGEPVGNSSDEFARWVKLEVAKWMTVVKAANIRVE